MADAVKLSDERDFQLGNATVRPSACQLAGPVGHCTVEPRVMQVLVALARAQGSTLSRDDLLDQCWNGRLVGEDAIHRAISQLRQLSRGVAGGAFEIHTVSRVGYRLDAGPAAAPVRDVEDALVAARDSWRMGRAAPDLPSIEILRACVGRNPESAAAWGALALLCRQAAEYAEPRDCAGFVLECDRASARALGIDPRNADAMSARAMLPPLFGNWAAARTRIEAAVAANGESLPALHDLAMLEMATGRPRTAAPLIEALLEREPLAPVLLYKRIFHLWTLGRLEEMDRVADRAMQLWPGHTAIWFARLWSLIGTGRAISALAQVDEGATRPEMPPAALTTLRLTTAVIAQRQLGEVAPAVEADAVRALFTNAARGPAQALAALQQLSALGAVDAAFDVARGYYLRRGPVTVGPHHTAEDWSATDQHRKVTQALFIPATQALRSDPRFEALCAEIGLADYWRQTGLQPDFRTHPA